MKLGMYAIWDNAVEAFGLPFFARAKGEAMRMFATGCNDANSYMSKSPSDYALFCLGEFDDSNGQVAVQDVPTKLALGLDMRADRSIM